jgi:nicotinamidase-related amidase
MSISNSPAAEPTVALLVLDLQRAFVEPAFRVPGINSHPDAYRVVQRLLQAIEIAHAARMLVVFVKVEFRPGYPEVGPRNRSFSRIAAGGGLLAGQPEAELHPAFVPRPTDIIVIKKGSSAFAGSDLETVLRARGISALVLGGIATSGVVLSTARTAVDYDYELTILSDACTDGDPELHAMLMERLFPRWANVVTTEEWIAGLPI